ncbi:hypothetical protein [Pedobacter sp. Leaf170]|uniref:hypothetical protein n=1 Tax=Pedobacter sp. Leaf170 TaxID=2876558 RepID=UPI001E3D729C|nr:hypothetical protein [Pedobacter sp. Leaf170]
MIKIIPQFSFADLQKDIEVDLQKVIEDFANKLFKAGINAVDLARAKTKANGGFGDISYRLRASIGCGLVVGGKLSEDRIYFPSIGEGEEGRVKGIAFLKQTASEVSMEDVALILVAGESYAGYVEALHDYDVITGTSKKLDKLFRELL